MKKTWKLLALLLVLTLALSLPAAVFADTDGAEKSELAEEAGIVEEAVEKAVEETEAVEAAAEEAEPPEEAAEESGQSGEPSPLVCGAGETLTAAEGTVICAEGGVVFNNGATVYNNGGTVYNNVGLVYNNAGTTFNNSGTVYVNGGVVFNNAGVVFFNDGELIDNAAPAEEEAPVEEETLVEEGAPVDEEVPVEEEAPIEEEAPAAADALVLTPPVLEDLTAGYGRAVPKAAFASVENAGAEPVTVARARITGPGANCFILSSANNVTIRPGETNADTWAVTPRYGLPAAEFSAVLELILDDGRIFELPFTLSVLKG